MLYQGTVLTCQGGLQQPIPEHVIKSTRAAMSLAIIPMRTSWVVTTKISHQNIDHISFQMFSIEINGEVCEILI